MGGALLLTTGSHARRNVLFLVSDDFNYWAGAIGYHEGVKTPNIDALAAKGVVFANAYSSSPVCNPSRNAFMSGYRPSTTGISTNQGGYIREINGFETCVTMNQYFKQNGYHSLGSGKIYHPGNMGSVDTDPSNWSEQITDGTGCNGGTYKKYNGSQYQFSGNTAAMSTSNCNDYAMALKIADRIKNYHTSVNKDKPFFIACGLFRPHAPFNSPKQFWDLLDPEKMKPGPGVEAKWMTGTQGTNFQKELIRDGVYGDAIQSYIACMALTDNNMGLILNALESSPLRDSTIIVFTGDHGFDLGEQGRWGKFAKNRSANNTSLIIYDPLAKGNGQKCFHPVTLQDLYPTLVELSGLPAKKDIEGVSLKHLLDCPTEENWNHPALMTYNGDNYISTRKWYFVEDGNSSLLFDNENDPYQWNNLYGQAAYNTIVANLRSKIDSMVLIGTKMRNDLRSPAKKVSEQNYNPFVAPFTSSCLCDDTIAPEKPGMIELEDSTATSLSIRWSDVADNTGVTEYHIYANNTLVAVTPLPTIVLSGLLCNTTYALKIAALDACKNISEFSNTVQYSTGQCDATPPSVPVAFTKTASDAVSVSLQWNASTDNDGIAGYQIWVNNELKNTYTDTVATIEGLDCNTGYAFKVRAVDFSLNYSDFSEIVNITTDECSFPVLPGKIEAESFTSMSGIQTENTSDTGGGLNIGFIHTGDWVEYDVNVSTTGAYNMQFRVASKNTGGTIAIMAKGVQVGSVDFAATGDWQTWTTINTDVELTAGIQKIRLNFSGSGSGFLFNVNWFDASQINAVRSNYDHSIRYLITTVVDERRLLFLNLLYSDPAVRIDIIDVQGRIVDSNVIPGEHAEWVYELPSDMKKGVYFLRVNNFSNSATERFIVM
jgi:arylsulfatase A-like enzyme/chitodextrinase